MSGKFFKVIFASILSIGLVSQANAAVIFVNDIDFKKNGLQWEKVGQFDLTGGVWFDDVNNDGAFGDYATSLSGIEAAELLFNKNDNEIWAISTTDNEVNHKALYEEFGGLTGVSKSESYKIDTNGNTLYDSANGGQHDSSAFIKDGAALTYKQGVYINYVFKRVVLAPAPSSLPIFALAIFGLAVRRIKC